MEQNIAKLKKDLTTPVVFNNSNLNNKEKTFQTESKPQFIKKFKKIKYKTLFDILEEREKYKLDNQSIEGIKNEKDNEKRIYINKNQLESKFNKKKNNLLKEYNINTSQKKHRNIIFNKYLSPFHVSNTKQNLMNSNENNNEIIKINLFNKTKNKGQKIESDFDEEVNYRDLIYSKKYREEHSTTTNDDYEKIEIKKDIKGKNKNHKLNLDQKKIYLKEQDNNLEIKKSLTKNYVKNKSEHNNHIRNISTINNMNSSDKNKNKIQKEKNKLIKEIYLDKVNVKIRERLNRSKDNIKEKILKENQKPNC